MNYKMSWKTICLIEWMIGWSGNSVQRFSQDPGGGGLRELLGNTVLAHDSKCDPVVPVLESPGERMNLSTLKLPLPAPSSHFLQLRQKIENKGSFPSEKNSSSNNNKWTWRMLSLVVLGLRGISRDRVTCTAAETKGKNPLKWASSPCLLLRDN